MVERYCAEAEKFGATSVIVNRLPDNFHPGLIEDPTNLYPKFFNWGPSLDMFFSTDLNRDVWPEELLTRNRKALLRTCEIARKYGLKPMLLLGEPRYQPERFFQKNPHLRGRHQGIRAFRSAGRDHCGGWRVRPARRFTSTQKRTAIR